MKLLDLDSVPMDSEDIVFEQSRWKDFLRFHLALVLLVVLFSIKLLFWRGSKLIERLYFGLILLILAETAFLTYLLATLGKNRWLLRYSQEGLFVKFRPRDREQPDQTGVLFLPFTEISSAGKWRENAQGDDRTFLELHLTPESCERIEEVIPKEEDSRAYLAKRLKLPYVFMKLKPKGRLLLEWMGPKRCLAPTVERMLELLSERVTVDSGRPSAKSWRLSR